MERSDTISCGMYVPFLSPFYGPAWIKQYIYGPYDEKFFNTLSTDICAGLTVAVTLIPQVCGCQQKEVL